MRRTIALALVVLATCLGSTSVAAERSFLMGMTPVNFDDSPEGTRSMRETLRSQAEVVAVYLDWGVPWPEALSGEPFHENVRKQIAASKERISPEHKVFLALNAGAFNRRELAGYWGESNLMPRPGEWANKNFDDAEVITAYCNYCERMIAEFHPTYLCYAIEINMLAGAEPARFEQFLVLAETTYTRLKRQHPDLIVFPTFQIDFGIAGNAAGEEVVRRLMPFSDAIAVSTYPHVCGLTPATLPVGWLADVRQLAPDKAFIVAETGYPAAPYEGTWLFDQHVQVDSSPETQEAYVRWLLNESNRLGAQLVTWFFPADINAYLQQEVERNSEAAGLAALAMNLGMADGEDHPRVALEAWKQWRRKEHTTVTWKYDAELLRPFWLGDIVQGESVLFVTDPVTGETAANVVYPPIEVLAVRNSTGDVTYEEGRDFVWERNSRRIVLPAGSRITARTREQLRRPANSQKYQLTHRDGNGEILFGSGLEYHLMQTSITYRHSADGWRPDVPGFDERVLPRSISKLRSSEPLSIVLLGDSISTGCNASGWAGAAPFQPPYPELLVRHLEARCGAKVHLNNLSVGGTDTAWGITKVDDVAAFKPDLVILAFGMNDAARRSAKDYQANVDTIIARTGDRLPDVEFILVASMLGNRDWTALQHERFPEYRAALAERCGAGVALADLTTVWTGLLEAKHDWDLTGNGVNHPNDFGHRIYAQVISSLLLDEQ